MNSRLRSHHPPFEGTANSKAGVAKLWASRKLPSDRQHVFHSEQKRHSHGCCNPAAFRHWSVFIFLFIAAACNPTSGQLAPPEVVSTRSVSGQFTVCASPSQAETKANRTNDENVVQLKPALTAVSCERIKQTLVGLLGGDSPWRGKILVALYPAPSLGGRATIVSQRFRDGWEYRLELPNPISREQFVRAIVQVLVMERAGRYAKDNAPEIPVWLVEGLTEHLLQTNGRELLLAPPRRSTNSLAFTYTVLNERRRDPLETARNILRERPPLTVAELSWPTDRQLAGDSGMAYRCGAQVFVTELLRLKDGHADLRAMLDGLGSCYNWQTAFFQAFRAHFRQQVDLEKWWALQLVHFTGRNPTQTWSQEESWRKLDEILRTPVEVRHAPNKLPGRAEISLATVIREWDPVSQSQTLRAKQRALDILRLRVSLDLIPLVDDYRRWLAAYLNGPNRAGIVSPTSKIAPPSTRNMLRETLRRLDELESQREALRPRPRPILPAQQDTDPTASP